MTRDQLIGALAMEDIPVHRLVALTDEELQKVYFSYYPDEADAAEEAGE